MHKSLWAATWALVLTLPPHGPAAAAAFCAYAGGTAGYENCHYYTFEQCLVAVRAAGGQCMRNPHDPALWAAPVAPPAAHRHQRRHPL